MIEKDHRDEAIKLIDEATENGCKLSLSCKEMGISIRTYQRWKKGDLEDKRPHTPKVVPSALSEEDKQTIVDISCSKEYRALTPHEIVPKLLEKNTYIASVRTFYRVLKERGLLRHRSNIKPKGPSSPPPRLEATGPNQVWCWDITYLPTTVAGLFYYAYVVIDMYSKKIIAWRISEVEEQKEAKRFFLKIAEGQEVAEVRLHSDNSGVMKGGTILQTIYKLGLIPSFSRPRVSNDNAYIESFFKTLKYGVTYPGKFDNILDAKKWMGGFIHWYNYEHYHSAIGYVTPHQCHSGEDFYIFNKRNKTLKVAYAFIPERFTKPPKPYERKPMVILGKKEKKNANIA